ncbi:hypothetical protein CHS0354_000111 [Potamilus streckersoni]|uniref:Uncharacterized protein n=1 Tax=Potamilus streckersoni TaxID=2493646 RepID=A0AAE0TJH3_9BIVA|nr:hypothetical protein CHS0354_000111 [Potamilus streckersoni]
MNSEIKSRDAQEEMMVKKAKRSQRTREILQNKENNMQHMWADRAHSTQMPPKFKRLKQRAKKDRGYYDKITTSRSILKKRKKKNKTQNSNRENNY